MWPFLNHEPTEPPLRRIIRWNFKMSTGNDNQFNWWFKLLLEFAVKCKVPLRTSSLVISALLFSAGNYFNQQIFETVSIYCLFKATHLNPDSQSVAVATICLHWQFFGAIFMAGRRQNIGWLVEWILKPIIL